MPPRDFVQCLARLAATRGEDVALTVVSQSAEGASVETVLSYDRLWMAVRALAATLQQQAVRGERALLLLDNDQHYVVSLLACFAAGIIAVPVFPPEPGRPQHAARLAGIAADAQAAIVLTTRALLPLVTEGMSSPGGARLLAVDAVDEDQAMRWMPHEPELTDVAFLQYTSGSTSAPKGVMVTHACLMANEAVIRERMSITQQDRFAVWSPLFHDMGLVGGLLQPLYSGIPCVLCSPEHFTASPVRWLRLIHRHRVTVSGGPDFAYRLCIDRIREAQCEGLDLGSWRVAYTGAEPIRPDTMQAFIEKFRRHGFSEAAVYPCYGLAEGTLMVTGGQAGQGMQTSSFSPSALARGEVRPEAGGMALVGCGQAAVGHVVRIVDPQTLQTAAADVVGEIWASGASIASGYWKSPAATAQAFVEDDEGLRWLRTGDLGFIRDGQLFVAGRLKDMIIVRGDNLYPQDVEQLVENEVDAVRKGRVAAFAVDIEGQEGVGVAAEISRGMQRRVAPEVLAGQIASVVAAQVGEAPRVIALLNAGGMPKTSSGKLQRQSCRQQWQTQVLDAWALFENGEMTQGPVRPGESVAASGATEVSSPSAASGAPEAAGVAPAVLMGAAADEALPLEGTGAELATCWGEVLGTAQSFTRRSHFFMHGGNSLSAVALAACVAERFHIPFRPHQVFQHPCLGEMAACVSGLQKQVEAGGLSLTAGFTELTQAQRLQPQPLSPAQLRQWFLWQLDPASTAYIIQGLFDVRGALDVQALHRAVEALVQRHASLRTQFLTSEDGQVRQRVLPAMPGVWQAEGQHVPLAERMARVRTLAARPFDLLAGPLLRVVLLCHDDRHHTLVMLMHHIIGDAASMQTLMNDLGALYAAERGEVGRAPGAPAPQYVDYAVWQHAHPAQTFSPDDLAWWQAELGRQHPALTFAAASSQAGTGPRPAAHVDAAVPLALFARVRERAGRLGTTPFVLLLTAWQLLLSRYSGQRRVRVGVPVANRDMPLLDGMVGCFVNTVVLQLQADDDLRLADLLARASAHHREAQARAGVPFDHLVEVLHPERMPAVNPLFQVAFNYLQEDLGGFARHAGLVVQPFLPDVQDAQFELTLEVRQPAPDMARLRFIHDVRTLPATLVGRMASQYLVLLERLVGDGSVRVGDLDLLDAAQRQQLTAWEQGGGPETGDHAVPTVRHETDDRPESGKDGKDDEHDEHDEHDGHDERARSRMSAAELVTASFGRHLAARPDAVALLFGEQTMSRAELERSANVVARALHAQGVRREDRVGIHQERSLDLVISMLGVLKAGAAFVPLDPELPAQRIAYMMQDSGLQVVLTHARLQATLPAVAGVTPLLLERILPPASTGAAVPGFAEGVAGSGQVLHGASVQASSGRDAQSATPSWAPPVHPDQLAYVIYTSGSTGMPKGVGVSHRGLARCMEWMQRVYGLGDDDTVLHKAPIGFDVSCWEIFWPLSAGVPLAIAGPGDHRDPQRIFALIRRHHVTVLNFMPQMLQLFLSCHGAAEIGLKRVMCGGEAITARLLSEAVPRLGEGVLQNLYGPTETTIHVTRWTCRDEDCTPVPIGRPIDATQAHVLDAALNRVPVGVPGELYIGGELLARGYINRPDLSAERFVANPFAGEMPHAQVTDDACDGLPAVTTGAGLKPARDQVASWARPGSRLYRTGDLVRWNEAGQLEYLGRIDEQIKIRGFRVELGEVEAQLLKQPGVREAVVVARETPQGTQLVGYVSAKAVSARRAGSVPGDSGTVVPEAEQAGHGANRVDRTAETSHGGVVRPNASDIRQSLRAVLPDYMVPSVIMVLDALPLNANGKTDRRALPAPVFDTNLTHEAPQGELEQQLAQIWAGVLGVARPDRQTNFFDLGGHSLLLATLRQRIQDELKVHVDLVDLFRFPTIQAQADHLRASHAVPASTAAAQAADDRGERRRQAMLRRKRG